MEIVILRNSDIVGTYDEQTRELESRDGRLQRLVTDGVDVLGAGKVEAEFIADAEVHVRPGEPAWFFAFIDTLWSYGYDVDAKTYAAITKRVRRA